jgi:hypothetical protein
VRRRCTPVALIVRNRPLMATTGTVTLGGLIGKDDIAAATTWRACPNRLGTTGCARALVQTDPCRQPMAAAVASTSAVRTCSSGLSSTAPDGDGIRVDQLDQALDRSGSSLLRPYVDEATADRTGAAATNAATVSRHRPVDPAVPARQLRRLAAKQQRITCDRFRVSAVRGRRS